MIYFIKDGDFVKIGYSQNPRARLINLQGANSRTLEIVGIMPGEKEHEAWLHSAFDPVRVRTTREWFFMSEAINKFIQKHSKPYSMDEIEAVVRKEKRGGGESLGRRSSLCEFYTEEPRKMKLDSAKKFIRTALLKEPQRSGYLRRIAPHNGVSISTFDNALRQLLNDGEVEVLEPGMLGDSRLLKLREDIANDARKSDQESGQETGQDDVILEGMNSVSSAPRFLSS